MHPFIARIAACLRSLGLLILRLLLFCWKEGGLLLIQTVREYMVKRWRKLPVNRLRSPTILSFKDYDLTLDKIHLSDHG